MTKVTTISTRRLLRILPAAPFKPERQLTCAHGRYWRSCNRCVHHQLPPDASESTVAIRGESCLPSPQETSP